MTLCGWADSVKSVNSLPCCIFQADVNLRDSLGRHALHLAAEAGCVAAVRFLVTDIGVNVNLQTVLTHCTSLHFAAKVMRDHFLYFSYIIMVFVAVLIRTGFVLMNVS